MFEEQKSEQVCEHEFSWSTLLHIFEQRKQELESMSEKQIRNRPCAEHNICIQLCQANDVQNKCGNTAKIQPSPDDRVCRQSDLRYMSQYPSLHCYRLIICRPFANQVRL